MKLAACTAAMAAAAWGAELETVAVEMRDGVHLATDIYNADAARPKPVLLIRTPYNKSGVRKQAEGYAAHDYVVVVQDCRGRYASEGAYTPYNNDRQDGYDAIEWINRQPWSNRWVGMFGGSHSGLVQWLAMAESAPGLAVIAPSFTASSLYRVAYRDRVLRMALISTGGVRASPPPPPAKQTEAIDLLYHDLPIRHLPLAELEKAYGWRLPWMTSLLEHPEPGGFWHQTSAEQEIAASTVPVQIVTGYYDLFLHDAVQDFFRLKARKSKAPIQMLLGPWTHGGTSRTKLGDTDFGPASRVDMEALNLAWFDRFLKSKGTGPAVQVRYFVMGENTWRKAGDWPPPGAQMRPLYLHAARKASFAAPREEPETAFVSDPNDPVPPVVPMRKDLSRSFLWSPLDYSGVADRPDVASFLTEPLDAGMIIAGPIVAELWIESDTPSADWVVRLFGGALPLAQGVFRDNAAPGRMHRISVDLGSVAARVKAGESLRIEIAGSNFPLYDRNLHTGEGPFSARMLVAHQKVFHRAATASRIILPALQN